MNEFRITPQALVNVVIASGLALLFASAPFGLLTTIGGITLLLILFSYDQGAQRSASQSLAFGAVCALPFTLAAGILLQQIAGPQNLKLGLALTWLCATILATAVDRSRMSSRAASSVSYPSAPVETPASPAHVSPPSRYGLGLGSTAPASEFPSAVHAEAPPPAYAPPAPVPEPPPVFHEAPPPPPAPIPEETIPAFTAAPPPPPPIAPVIPPANPAAVTVIHVNVIGQGISLLRPVQAEHIARDIYRIIEPMPAGERWKYETGQAVRCRKQKLSSGKALVAYEEVILQRVS
jgi:hypothetical protein